jgi:excisionase family DNA binding protein
MVSIQAPETLIDWSSSAAMFSDRTIQMARLNEYVKVAEASLILGVAQNTLRSWAEAGKIPMHKNPANRYRLFRRSDLERFLAKVARPARD